MSFTEFVTEQVRRDEKLRETIIAAVHDDEVPMAEVDDDLPAATVKVTSYDRETRIVATEVRVPWTGVLAADDEGEMTENGCVVGNVRFKHLGQTLEYVGGTYEVRYDTFFTEGDRVRSR